MVMGKRWEYKKRNRITIMAAKEQAIRANAIKAKMTKLKLKISVDCVVKGMRQ